MKARTQRVVEVIFYADSSILIVVMSDWMSLLETRGKRMMHAWVNAFCRSNCAFQPTSSIIDQYAELEGVQSHVCRLIVNWIIFQNPGLNCSR